MTAFNSPRWDRWDDERVNFNYKQSEREQAKNNVVLDDVHPWIPSHNIHPRPSKIIIAEQQSPQNPSKQEPPNLLLNVLVGLMAYAIVAMTAISLLMTFVLGTLLLVAVSFLLPTQLLFWIVLGLGCYQLPLELRFR